MANQPNDERSHEAKPGELIHESRIGRVNFRIYRNVNLVTGDYYQVNFRRCEWNKAEGKEWKVKGFFREDLVNVAKSALTCHWWLVDNVGFASGPVPNVFPKPLPVEKTPKSPVYEFMLGNVLGTIFENTSERGNLYHKFYLRCGDASGESGMVWNSFGPENMYHLAQATTHCRMWLEDRLAVLRGVEVTGAGEKKQPAKRKPRRAAK